MFGYIDLQTEQQSTLNKHNHSQMAVFLTLNTAIKCLSFLWLTSWINIRCSVESSSDSNSDSNHHDSDSDSDHHNSDSDSVSTKTNYKWFRLRFRLRNLSRNHPLIPTPESESPQVCSQQISMKLIPDHSFNSCSHCIAAGFHRDFNFINKATRCLPGCHYLSPHVQTI